MADQSGEIMALGLDLGANSIGWALLAEKDGTPERVIATGVRVFEAGVEGDIESGKDESRNTKRRDARLIRRQAERRARRHVKVAGILQKAGLLPEGGLEPPQSRHEYFTKLDAALRGRYAGTEQSRTFPHVFPYWLRAQALERRLELDELGRALYHLCQRRGFLSNRKAAAKEKDDEKSVVKQGIKQLSDEIRESGARTLGAYFAGLDPVDPDQRRIRERWTSRQMYLDEFEEIWKAQAQHYPEVLTPERHKELYRAMFFQRPLKIQRHLVGACPFELDKKRAPMALLIAQRFRLLQKVNDLVVEDADFNKRPLTPDERAALIAKLETQQEIKFTQARKELKIPKGSVFNLERGGEERMIGNRTAAKFADIFKDRWAGFTDEEKDRIVEDVRSFEKDAALAKRGREHYGLDEEAAEKFGELDLEPGYGSLSRQALLKIVPLLEQGISYATAVKDIYGEQGGSASVAYLPSMAGAIGERIMPELRNPVVNRVLTELRKVVNAIIEKHGTPDKIRIELARDIKKPRDARKKIWQRNRQNEKGRKSAAGKIIAETGNEHPSRDEVEKVLLWEECGGLCPYTGKGISLSNLLGPASQFDIEHIIPFSRSLDNSFINKTLCYHEENRSNKRNNTPYEAYGAVPERYDEILERVKRFKSDGRDAKLKRFRMQTLDSFDDFTSRQLNDTRYASTLAAKYMGLLYGSEWRKHIQVSTGQTTGYLRDVWALNKILGDGGAKNREDHRHHAVDAIAIALTTPKTVKELSQAASRAESENRRQFAKVPPPWENFFDDVRAAINQIVVSHRVSRKVNGRLHEDTFYSPQGTDENGKPCVHVRKKLGSLSVGDIEAIVDPTIREVVKRKLDELGGDPKKAFAQPENHPRIRTKTGQMIPVHKVRVAKVLTTFQVGEGPRARHVTSDTNHHMEILEVTDKKGQTCWEDVVVSQYDAIQRMRLRQPIVQRDHSEGKRFVFSLASGDTVEMDDAQGNRALYIIRTVSKEYLAYVRLVEARKKKDIMKRKEDGTKGDWEQRSPNGVRTLNCRKVLISPLGEVRRAND